MAKLKVLEVYSGIGGMHWALKQSGVEYEVVLAVDINTTANMVYRHNFPDTNLQCFGLEKLTLQKLENLAIDMILMSPPCQPFTRVGKKGDCEDVRTMSFLHILRLVRGLDVKPKYLLVENVKGFEISQAHNKLIECLEDCGFIYQQFLLTPLQFGIPNCRLRYYIIATQSKSFVFPLQPEIMTNMPNSDMSKENADSFSNAGLNHNFVKDQPGSKVESIAASMSNEINCCEHSITPTSKSISIKRLSCQELDTTRSRNDVNPSGCSPEKYSTDSTIQLSGHTEHSETKQTSVSTTKYSLCELKNAGRNMRYCEEDDKFINDNSLPLSKFMESASFDTLKEYWLSDRELRFFIVLDIVYPVLKKSTCFTKRYGHYVDGAGSVVQMSSNIEDILAASKLKSCAVNLKNRSEWGEAELDIIRRLQLRYFTPQEVANLLCFPSEFSFPLGLNIIQKYRVLGNSLNVHVVAQLIKLMTQI